MKCSGGKVLFNKCLTRETLGGLDFVCIMWRVFCPSIDGTFKLIFFQEIFLEKINNLWGALNINHHSVCVHLLLNNIHRRLKIKNNEQMQKNLNNPNEDKSITEKKKMHLILYVDYSMIQMCDLYLIFFSIMWVQKVYVSFVWWLV